MQAAPRGLRLEHLADGAFVGTSTPRLSWRWAEGSATPLRSQVEVELGHGPDVRTIEGARSSLIEWPFAPLGSRARGMLRVRAEADGGWGPWSDPVSFETTLLEADDWNAVLIEPVGVGGLDEPAPVFSTAFETGDVESARLYITAHGVFEAEINGDRVGDEILSPGWTAYRSRLRFLTYDVTTLLRSGQMNSIDVLVGNGWFRGRLGWSGARAHYGASLGLIAQLEVTRPDGSRDTFATGPDWAVRESHVIADDLYDGVEVDLRPRPPRTASVRVGPEIRRVLFPSFTAPIRELARLAPVEVRKTGDGATLVDFGQNFTGWVSLRVAGLASRKIEIRHAEILVDGALATETLRTARALDTYVLAADEARTLEPRLTFHGFRYAEIRGADLESIHDIVGVVIGSDLERTGWFQCSDERVNRLHDNIVRSARSNLIDVPIDCPQRDERLGWTGDLQLFAPAASFLFDMAAMLDSWLTDLRCEQHPDGSVPAVIPDVIGELIAPGAARGAGFSDAAVMVPLAAYRAYGDARLVEQQWESARRWVRRALEAAGEDRIWEGGFQWGDWLDPSAPSGDPSQGSTPVDLVATAALARTVEALSELASVASPDDVPALRDEHSRLLSAFTKRYVTHDGLVLGDSVSAYVFAIRLAALDPQQRLRAAERLISHLRGRGYRASTGFLGTAQVLDALDDIGASDIAMRMLLTDRMPSWLAQVRLGATTVWERWDSLDDDGVVNDPFMTSFNHFALGSVADWIHRRVGGLAPAAPGYRTARIAPILTSSISSASVRHESPHGEISVEWARGSDGVTVDIILPPGVDAVVDIPGVPGRLPSGRHHFRTGTPQASSRGDDASADRLVEDVLADEDQGTRLIDLLVRLGIADDDDDAYRRLSPYASMPVRDLADEIAHPAFRAAGPFVRRAFLESLGEGRPDVRTY
ncbi:alpha-L-rhamnosidase [Microbacterium sp. MYb45]|uniref:alpha-L-rhamnosidase n=1 Tax=Microbacterium sp. MYb45 TaxID=1827294 RepID=UPI0011AFE0E0|nr:alpha-L-rhamnosidase [Microbacterium sp. MYb45]